MSLAIDHVPFAWSDLDEITGIFEALGLSPEYGGVHDNGCTHMSVLGFDDSSYIELIAEQERGDHDFWPAHIRADAGPAAWCVRVPDIVAECRRLIDCGVPIRGPFAGARERADGTLVEWDRAVIGETEEHGVLPFAIADRTPLEYRVSPTPSVAGGPLTGIGQVVLAVDDVDRTVELFQRLYRCPQPRSAAVAGFGEVASFPGQPLALTATSGEDWLVERGEQFRDGPCSVLLETPDLSDARAEYDLTDSQSWPDGEVAFFASDVMGYRLGVVTRD